jgi:3-deoxy-D-manno-octulosonic-acid transferase
MARSFGLAAYRAFAGRGGAVPFTPVADRPNGELVWCHAPEPGSLLAIQDLAARLCRSRSGLRVLITLPKDDIKTELPHSAHADVLIDFLPSDHPTSVAGFLDHWRPNACIWAWGRLRPNLIIASAQRRCPLFLIDADNEGFDGRRDRWLRDFTRDLIKNFSAIMARSEAGFQRLVRLGVARDSIEMTPALQAGGQALPCIESDLADLSAALVGRPVWFANQILEEELGTVLTAHRQALRLSHRLLLVLMPADPSLVHAFAKRLEDQDFRVLRWGDAGYPDSSTQVMLTDDPAEIGLFYRLAPVSFLGSSLTNGPGGCDPFEAAALGSAILYGPKVRRFLPSYTRLATEGAARIVNDATALGTAVSRLIAPDQTAVMAHAGWDVISRGAALTDKVIDLVQDTLDLQEART